MGSCTRIQTSKKLKNILLHFDLFLCLDLFSFDFIFAMTNIVCLYM
jgi:hypothetical protein